MSNKISAYNLPACWILPFDLLGCWRSGKLIEKKRVVVTNGCFDILHAGHVAYLEAARQLGDVLLVGINGDESVRALNKGPGRPINGELDRAKVVAALRAVDAVCIFPGRAVDFLEIAMPDVYVKGGDYTLETLNQEERRMVEFYGAEIHFIPFVPGKSTTKILQKMRG